MQMVCHPGHGTRNMRGFLGEVFVVWFPMVFWYLNVLTSRYVVLQ